jgi:hypothetical protein
MDLDAFQNDYRVFKARITPMLEAWEAHGGAVSPVDKETADALNAEIYKPLPPKDLSDPTIRQVVVPGTSAAVAAADAKADTDAKGPTVQQWVSAGYLASNYATRFPDGPSSAEDIAAAVATEKSAPLMPASIPGAAPGVPLSPMPGSIGGQPLMPSGSDLSPGVRPLSGSAGAQPLTTGQFTTQAPGQVPIAPVAPAAAPTAPFTPPGAPAV